MTKAAFDTRLNAFFGTFCFMLAAVLTCLVFVHQWTSIDLHLPAIWYRSRNFHVLICVVLYAAGWWAHRAAARSQRAAAQLIRSVTVYSRPNCSLCDRAMKVLEEFAAELPPINVVDITGDEELERQYSDSIPVVEMDGRVRFRGIVSAELVRRLLDARWRQRADGVSGEPAAGQQVS
ncbi:MAG: glutaredoxin family protein [Fuerstiella sp.]